MKNFNNGRGKYMRLFLFAVAIGAASLFSGFLPANNTAEAQTDLLLERRLSQIEQRFYLLESRLSRLEQNSSPLFPQSSTRSDTEISLLRSQIESLSVQIDALRMRIGDLECGLERVDERTLSPAAREARRKADPTPNDPCRANPNLPVRLMSRP
jgi:uncharacterized protein YceH (UPF0502 family)